MTSSIGAFDSFLKNSRTIYLQPQLSTEEDVRFGAIKATICFRELYAASSQEAAVVALIISHATSPFFASFALARSRRLFERSASAP